MKTISNQTILEREANQIALINLRHKIQFKKEKYWAIAAVVLTAIILAI